jgi:GAF domain-containing protein
MPSQITAYSEIPESGPVSKPGRIACEHEGIEADALSCAAERARLHAKVASLMNQNLRMHEELRATHEAMKQNLGSMTDLALRQCLARYATVFQQNEDLVNLHVASARLHESAARHDVLVAIEEIVINLIGSEQIAVLEVAKGSDALTLVSSCGIDEERYENIRLGEGILGRVALTGEPWIAAIDHDDPGAHEEPDLTACVPLKLYGRVVGVLAVFRLLGHKPSLAARDHQLLALVSTQAAPALYCTRMLAQ